MITRHFICRRFVATELSLWWTVSVISALTINNTPLKGPEAWRRAEIDYSAANEFVRSYYGDEIEQPYFATSTCDGKVVEPIYNAREGFWDDDLGQLVPPSLSRCGFTLLHAPTTVADFFDLDQVRSIYLPHLREQVIPRAFKNDGSSISDIIFWFPMYRREEQLTQGTSRSDNCVESAPIAPLAHIDTDVGAYQDVTEVMQLVDKNRVDDAYQAQFFDPSAIECALKSGRRFAIVNLWRNANFQQQPILRAPLAILSTRYSHHNHARPCFPDAKPDPITSRWYTFPNMSHDECLLFCQYDRNLQKPSDMWHCALSSICERDAPPRQSLDVRALIVFDEIVPPELDRFAPGRMRPILSQSESESFCEEQDSVERNKAKVLVEKMR
jgi:hypothetical protein